MHSGLKLLTCTNIRSFMANALHKLKLQHGCVLISFWFYVGCCNGQFAPISHWPYTTALSKCLYITVTECSNTLPWLLGCVPDNPCGFISLKTGIVVSAVQSALVGIPTVHLLWILYIWNMGLLHVLMWYMPVLVHSCVKLLLCVKPHCHGNGQQGCI